MMNLCGVIIPIKEKKQADFLLRPRKHFCLIDSDIYFSLACSIVNFLAFFLLFFLALDSMSGQDTQFYKKSINLARKLLNVPFMTLQKKIKSLMAKTLYLGYLAAEWKKCCYTTCLTPTKTWTLRQQQKHTEGFYVMINNGTWTIIVKEAKKRRLHLWLLWTALLC